jgi:hypothetical protein
VAFNALGAALIDGDKSVDCSTLGEAVIARDNLPEPHKIAPTIKCCGRVSKYSPLRRLIDCITERQSKRCAQSGTYLSPAGFFIGSLGAGVQARATRPKTAKNIARMTAEVGVPHYMAPPDFTTARDRADEFWPPTIALRQFAFRNFHFLPRGTLPTAESTNFGRGSARVLLAALAEAARRYGSCLSRSSNSLAHIMFCVRETANEQ